MSAKDIAPRDFPRCRRWGWLAAGTVAGLAVSIAVFVPAAAARDAGVQKASAKYKVALLEVGTPTMARGARVGRRASRPRRRSMVCRWILLRI